MAGFGEDLAILKAFAPDNIVMINTMSTVMICLLILTLGSHWVWMELWCRNLTAKHQFHSASRTQLSHLMQLASHVIPILRWGFFPEMHDTCTPKPRSYPC